MKRSFISTEELAESPHSGIIGYPHATRRQILQRIGQMERLGIRSVAFEGPVSVGRTRVLGKGYVGVVVLARMGSRSVALKIRRTDSQRDDMKGEAALLKAANAAGVGPRFYGASRNFLAMEYVRGQRIGDWVQSVRGRGSATAVKAVVRKILLDCRRLDLAGIDHGELSSISKHVIVGETRQAMIDFESSSVNRKTSNVTSAAQAIFIGSGVSKAVRTAYRAPPEEEIIESLRAYKKDKTARSFEGLLGVLRL